MRDQYPYSRVTLDNEIGTRRGAVALDGSPAVFYIRPSPIGSSRWMLFFEGGGWCLSAGDCIGRSATGWGSGRMHMAKLPESAFQSPIGWALQGGTAMGAALADFNIVVMRYCDGASFSGEAHIGTSGSVRLAPRRLAAGGAPWILRRLRQRSMLQELLLAVATA